MSAPQPPGEAMPQQAAPPEAQPELVDHREDAPDVAEPAKLLRIAGMVRALLEEVRSADLGEEGRERLMDIHNRSLVALREVLSDELAQELNEIALSELRDGPPTSSELRVAQAQLAGWLEGLFHGIQASVASQQLAAQQQLAQMRRRGAVGPGGQQQRGQQPGQYL